jgi:putative aldouronate transport system permease protein
MPIIGVTLIMNMGNLIRDDFEQIYALVGSSNYNLVERTQVFGTLIYSALRESPSAFGGATALGLLQSVISLILVAAANYFVRRTGNPSMW